MDGGEPQLERLNGDGSRGVWRYGAALVIGLVLCALAQAQSSPRVEIANDGGYAQVLLDGTPFFPHAATFDYARIPRDLWENSLQDYRTLGINTLELTIPWNWHEIEPGVFDFDGHTNPRRDLQKLLKMAAADSFCLIVRPGPAAGDLWRNAGFPEWLGRENAAGSEEQWFEAVGRELALYQDERANAEAAGGTGPSAAVLFVEFDESGKRQASPFVGHRADWEAALERGGFRMPRVLTALDAARGIEAAGKSEEKSAGASAGLAGQWFFAPPETLQDVPPGGARLQPQNVATLTLLGGELGLPNEFPPLVMELAASGHAPADDSRAVASDPANLLIATRLLLGLGVRGIGYAPLQDTLTPAGWETTQANRYVRWDAALDLAGNVQPQAHSVERNARLLRAWGTQLASAHLRADFGIVVRRASANAGPRSERGETRMIEQIERVAQIAEMTPELLDLGEQPRQTLLRDDVVFLPDGESGTNGAGADLPELSDAAQSALVEYVRGGGTLVCFPRKPPGSLMEALWREGQREFDGGPGVSGMVWKAGEGSVIVVADDFYSWVNPAEPFEENRAAPQAGESVRMLKQLIAASGGAPVIERAAKDPAGEKGDLIVTQLVAGDPGAVVTGRSSACAELRLCAAALVSATNLSWDAVADETLKFGLPTPGPRVRQGDSDTEQLEVRVPARDSLLLPFHAPLCGAEPGRTTVCPDELIAAGAELLAAQREGKSLELFLYAPERASIVLRLQKPPTHAEVEDVNLPFSWNEQTHRLELSLPRGAAPDFLRLLKIDLPYVPAVREAADPSKLPGRYSVSVASATGLPLGSDVSSLPSYPSLVLLDPEGSGAIVLDARRYGPEGPPLRAAVSGQANGSRTVRLGDDESTLVRIKLTPGTKEAEANVKGQETDASQTPGDTAAPGEKKDELPRGELQFHAGNASWTQPLAFLTSGRPSEKTKAAKGDDAGDAEGQTVHYRFDFDRDGSDEWVLENLHNRLVFSPADGGRALAWVDKDSGMNLFSTSGGLEDSLTDADGSADRTVGTTAGLVAYSAEWADAGKDGVTAIRLQGSLSRAAGDGVEIEKTARLTDGNAMEIAYQFALGRQANPAAGAAGAKSLTVVTPVPATTGEIGGTSFCWEPGDGDAQNAGQGAEGSTDNAPASHCEEFVPGGPGIEIPPGVMRLEVRTPGQDAVGLQWNGGDVRVVPRNYSAQIRWQLPAAMPGGKPVEASMRFTKIALR